MYVMVTYKNEEDQMKNEYAKWSKHYRDVFYTLKGSKLYSCW